MNNNFTVPINLNQLRERLQAGSVYTSGGYSLRMNGEIIWLKGKDIGDASFRNLDIAICTLLSLIGKMTEQDAFDSTVTLRYYMDKPPSPGYSAYYKDMYIADLTLVSNAYGILTLRIPLPDGGTVQEAVHIDTARVELRKYE
jgi:hypothetical protein